MKALKPGLAALILVAELSGSARAQGIAGGYVISPGIGLNSGYYGGYGNYGGYSNYGGYGRGYYYNPAYNLNVPQTYNNMGGLMNAIRQQTGKPGSYRNGYTNYGVSRGRRFP